MRASAVITRIRLQGNRRQSAGLQVWALGRKEVAKQTYSLGIHSWPRRDRRVPDAQMGEGAPISADQGAVGVRGKIALRFVSPMNGTMTPATHRSAAPPGWSSRPFGS